jgi:hypothetical protein
MSAPARERWVKPTKQMLLAVMFFGLLEIRSSEPSTRSPSGIKQFRYSPDYEETH